MESPGEAAEEGKTTGGRAHTEGEKVDKHANTSGSTKESGDGQLSEKAENEAAVREEVRKPPAETASVDQKTGDSQSTDATCVGEVGESVEKNKTGEALMA